jgi:hypothetical protein
MGYAAISKTTFDQKLCQYKSASIFIEVLNSYPERSVDNRFDTPLIYISKNIFPPLTCWLYWAISTNTAFHFTPTRDPHRF